jgi:Flp pilus assembly protein TadD
MSPETNQTRRAFLEEVVHHQPDDTFARYGLAMELAGSEPAVAWTHFTYLLEHHPEYAATYYQAGAFLTRLGRVEEARRVLTTGLEVTGRQGNRHAKEELQSALDDLNDNL